MLIKDYWYIALSYESEFLRTSLKQLRVQKHNLVDRD